MGFMGAGVMGWCCIDGLVIGIDGIRGCELMRKNFIIESLDDSVAIGGRGGGYPNR